ncbi:potassium channel family protein [Peribacillus sp. SCS-37]|uniref:potassium channel family protein n=1 Tax=Paraperibacillus esterisolvens TaxID=3115296 RepID=UPI003905C354
MADQMYAVIGLGRFGLSVAKRLYEAGQEVLGIDMDEERVEDAELSVTHAVVADTTEEESLKSIGVRNFDVGIVAIGSDMQSSVLTVLLLKEQGVKKVIAKAVDRHHGKVLEKVGADWVIYPDRDMGERVAHQLLSPNVINYIELSRDYHIEEVKVPQSMDGKKLGELDIRAEYNITVIAVVDDGDIIVSPPADQVITRDNIMVVIGHRNDLESFTKAK